MAISKPSKSARKREYLALQAIGEKLIGLTAVQLQSMQMDPKLLDAILAAKNIRSRGALQRQKQLIGKLIARENPVPIQSALDGFGRHDSVVKEMFHQAEKWRDRIVDEGLVALQDYFAFIGSENAELATTVDALSLVQNDRSRRSLQRKVFRQIHQELQVRVQNDSD